MTRVCLLGLDEVDIRVDLLAYESARQALAQYELEEPYANTLSVETISLGAAVSLLNDLDWYLARLVDRAIILEPSISDSEWLSRALATEIRNETVEPAETADLLEIHGVIHPADGRSYLTEPLYARRISDEIPEYDLQDVDDTLVVRVTPSEFG